MSVSRFSKPTFAVFSTLMLAACTTTGEPSPTAAIKAAEETPKKPVFLQKDILGETAADLDQKLGEPALVRREGAGEFRRYTLANCGLIVILYAGDKGAKTVEHIDVTAKSSEETKPAIDTCLAAGLPKASVGS